MLCNPDFVICGWWIGDGDFINQVILDRDDYSEMIRIFNINVNVFYLMYKLEIFFFFNDKYKFY